MVTKGSNLVQTRLSDDEVSRLDAIVDKHADVFAEAFGVRLTRSRLISMCIRHGLGILENGGLIDFIGQTLARVARRTPDATSMSPKSSDQ